ncbi:MAG TPA: hypothetical protein VEF04_13245, partial [Blastocatellia bacterium]|nr:hypothetical protein [Blastocatellia bacterium]
KSQLHSDFIKSHVDSLGTFILEAYFKAMARLCKDEDWCYEWVIARLDNVIEKEEIIEIVGKAERYAPQFFE